MVNENIIPQTETVYELKNEIPSFEEFMKTYQNDSNLNYADLNIGDIGEVRGYGPCSYDSGERRSGHRINQCGDRDCSYYRRISDSSTRSEVGAILSTSAGIGFIAGLIATPFTGGASLLAATALSAGASTSLVGGNAATMHFHEKFLDEVESELKLKWKSEQVEERRINRLKQEEQEREREKNRKINSLQGQLNEAKRELERTIEEMDMCKNDSDYTREKNKKERLENKVRNLKKDLCREKDCNCDGYCL